MSEYRFSDNPIWDSLALAAVEKVFGDSLDSTTAAYNESGFVKRIAGESWAVMFATEKPNKLIPIVPGLTKMYFTIDISKTNYPEGISDFPDGTPARSRYYPDGTILELAYFSIGGLSDPEPGVPAFQTFYDNGRLSSISHYTGAIFCDLPNGLPATMEYSRDGKILSGTTMHGRTISDREMGKLVTKQRSDALDALCSSKAEIVSLAKSAQIQDESSSYRIPQQLPPQSLGI